MEDANPVTGDEAWSLAQADDGFWSSTPLGPVAQTAPAVLKASSFGPIVDELISDPFEPDKQSTRRILRAQSVPENPGDPTALVCTTLMAQRRGLGPASRGEPWEDADHFNLATMSSGKQVKLDLGPNATKRLVLALVGRYKSAGTYDQIMAEIGDTVINETEVLFLHGRERAIVEALLEDGDVVWDLLKELQPDMFKAVALRQQHEARCAALAEFADKMRSGEWDEGDWEQFFKDNTWIFGYGLAYQFLSTIQNQPHYGGTLMDGTGAERGDF